MAGQDDTMRLAAEIVDKWSGPLKAMNKAMRETGGIARGVHGAGEKSVTAHDKAYRELHNTINKVRGTISSAFTPTMATLGITTLSVGGAIASVVASVKKLGDSYYQIQDASKRAGLSAQHIDALTVAFENLGIAPDAARSGLSNLGQLLDQTSRRVPEAIQHWNALGGAYQLLGSQLQGLSRSDQLNKITEFMSTHPMSVDQRRKMWSDVLAAPELAPLATKSGEQIRKALAQGMQFEKEHPYDPAQAEKINDAFIKLRVTLEGVERDLGNVFGSRTAEMINSIAQDIRDLAKAMIDVDKFLTKWGAYFRKDDSFFKEHQPKPGLIAPGDHGTTLSDRWTKLKGFFGNSSPLPPKNWSSGGGDGDDATIPKGARPRMYSPADDEKTIKKGTLDALREWWNGMSSAPAGGGGGGTLFRRGIRQGGGAGGGGGGGGGGGAAGGSAGGAGEMPDLSGLSGNEYLKAQRARFAGEFAKNPNLKLRADAITSLENEGAKTGVMESLFNRMSMVHRTAESGMSGGSNSFYGPGRHPGMIEARMRAIANNPKWHARLDALTDAALAGSNLIRGHTDQGSRGDPNYEAGGVGVNINRERFNDWGVAGSRRWREEQQSHVHGADRSVWDTGAKPLDLLKLGKQSGLMGGPQGFKSDASLRIDVNAPPGSVKTRLAHSGFEAVQFNRGLQMANASQVG